MADAFTQTLHIGRVREFSLQNMMHTLNLAAHIHCIDNNHEEYANRRGKRSAVYAVLECDKPSRRRDDSGMRTREGSQSDAVERQLTCSYRVQRKFCTARQ